MESEAEDYQTEFKTHVFAERKLESFELYEQYSRRDIVETIQGRKDAYLNASSQAREGLKTEAEIEVENFQIWLESVRQLASPIAYYYSISLKSLLLGLPLGVAVARLFSVALENLEASQSR
jgi:hypothetical protein